MVRSLTKLIRMRGENCVDASVSVISMIANTIDTTVMIEVAMLLRIICATPGSSREGKRTFGTHALISGAASSSHDSTAPAVPRNRAIIKGRIRNPPRRAYIAERKSAGSRSNILECPESGQRTLRLAPGQTEINQNRSSLRQTCFVVATEPRPSRERQPAKMGLFISRRAGSAFSVPLRLAVPHSD